MKLAEFRRLSAMMARTFSDSDNEALTSIRMANRILAAHDLTWEKVFAKTVTIINEFEADPVSVSTSPAVRRGTANVEEDEQRFSDEQLLCEAESAVLRQSLNAKQFVESVRTWFDDGRNLTPKQRNALRDVRDR